MVRQQCGDGNSVVRQQCGDGNSVVMAAVW